jgi:uncharacterized FlaG/YvyC family protein
MQVNATAPITEFNPTFQTNVEKPKEVKIEKSKTETSNTKTDNKENLDQLKNVLAENNINLEFSQDNETKQLVVKLVDNVTGEAIRQIPTEISLKLAAVFVKMKGQFVDTKE